MGLHEKFRTHIPHDVPFPLPLRARYRRPTVSKAIGRARSSIYARVSGRALLYALRLISRLSLSRRYIDNAYSDAADDDDDDEDRNSVSAI